MLRIFSPLNLVGLNAVDLYRGERLTVPLFAPVAFAAFVFEYDDFGRFALLDDMTGDGNVVEMGGADLEIFAIGKQQDIIEGNLGPDVAGKLFDPQDVPLLNPVLFSACFDHSVHTASFIPSGLIAAAPRLNMIEIRANFLLGFKTLQYYFTKTNCQAKKLGPQF